MEDDEKVIEKIEKEISEEIDRFTAKDETEIVALLLDMAQIRVELKKGYLSDIFFHDPTYNAYALKIFFEKNEIVDNLELSQIPDIISSVIRNQTDGHIDEALFCTELTILCMCLNLQGYGKLLWGYLKPFVPMAVEALENGLFKKPKDEETLKLKKEITWDPIAIYEGKIEIAKVDKFENILEHTVELLESSVYSERDIMKLLILSDFTKYDSGLVMDRAKTLWMIKTAKRDSDMKDHLDSMLMDTGISKEDISQATKNAIVGFLSEKDGMPSLERSMLSEITKSMANSLKNGSTREELAGILERQGILTKEDAITFLNTISIGLGYHDNVDWSVIEKVRIQNADGDVIKMTDLEKESYEDFIECHFKRHSVYLRSHRDDKDLFKGKLFGKNQEKYNYEQICVNDLTTNFGMPVAILGPEEKGGDLRFPRFNTEHRDWRITAKYLMITSSIVLIRFNLTKGLLWEITNALKYVKPESLIIGFPDYMMLEGKKEEWRRIWDCFIDLTKEYIGDVDDKTVRAKCCHFLWFNKDWVPSFSYCPNYALFSQTDRILWSLKKMIDDRHDLKPYAHEI